MQNKSTADSCSIVQECMEKWREYVKEEKSISILKIHEKKKESAEKLKLAQEPAPQEDRKPESRKKVKNETNSEQLLVPQPKEKIAPSNKKERLPTTKVADKSKKQKIAAQLPDDLSKAENKKTEEIAKSKAPSQEKTKKVVIEQTEERGPQKVAKRQPQKRKSAKQAAALKSSAEDLKTETVKSEEVEIKPSLENIPEAKQNVKEEVGENIPGIKVQEKKEETEKVAAKPAKAAKVKKERKKKQKKVENEFVEVSKDLKEEEKVEKIEDEDNIKITVTSAEPLVPSPLSIFEKMHLIGNKAGQDSLVIPIGNVPEEENKKEKNDQNLNTETNKPQKVVQIVEAPAEQKTLPKDKIEEKKQTNKPSSAMDKAEEKITPLFEDSPLEVKGSTKGRKEQERKGPTESAKTVQESEKSAENASKEYAEKNKQKSQQKEAQSEENEKPVITVQKEKKEQTSSSAQEDNIILANRELYSAKEVYRPSVIADVRSYNMNTANTETKKTAKKENAKMEEKAEETLVQRNTHVSNSQRSTEEYIQPQPAMPGKLSSPMGVEKQNTTRQTQKNEKEKISTAETSRLQRDAHTSNRMQGVKKSYNESTAQEIEKTSKNLHLSSTLSMGHTVDDSKIEEAKEKKSFERLLPSKDEIYLESNNKPAIAEAQTVYTAPRVARRMDRPNQSFVGLKPEELKEKTFELNQLLKTMKDKVQKKEDNGIASDKKKEPSFSPVMDSSDDEVGRDPKFDKQKWVDSPSMPRRLLMQNEDQAEKIFGLSVNTKVNLKEMFSSLTNLPPDSPTKML
ncbi:hypothetical protein NEMIN01_0779 [Nematocida minor]|uniref:uncharacterized protein n=1 Tax=Nematocida minor TaxID=1912983 RepID=UPI00221EA135|nr:uncharacterized protein NEMIN01_0779 [Nematocida minor]KAI5189916.1 hypothetical protein NEMIN01_0779 [Nematocida minor]